MGGSGGGQALAEPHFPQGGTQVWQRRTRPRNWGCRSPSWSPAPPAPAPCASWRSWARRWRSLARYPHGTPLKLGSGGGPGEGGVLSWSSARSAMPGMSVANSIPKCPPSCITCTRHCGRVAPGTPASAPCPEGFLVSPAVTRDPSVGRDGWMWPLLSPCCPLPGVG